ncbi:M20 family metallo-hydrolase [Salinisphaera sp. SPP-AMP-43]|uniref:M20 family metallo-hydrolase n=1 Tax=Salinisphaera sp. SPP-AMP-43 TaxID=3121288 RepID=UPI003C6DEC9A
MNGADHDTSRLATALDGEAFWQNMQDSAAIGRRCGGGIKRLALDDADIEARRWLITRGEALGCQAYFDDAANVFIRREGQDPTAAPLLLGSHLDSQPAAGIYDGALGVISGLAVLQTVAALDMAHRRPIELVSWTNEEGARFTPGMTGSSVFAGAANLDTLGDACDADGIRLRDALNATLAALAATRALQRAQAPQPYAYLETHIEQGPVLEEQGLPVGVVTGIQGVRWFRFTVTGVAGHAGTTPRSLRQDAFDGACRLANTLRETATDTEEQVRFTIGRFEVEPGAVNTIPDRVTFTVDLRHPNATKLEALEASFRQLSRRDWAGCHVQLERLIDKAPIAFPTDLTDLLANSVTTAGLPAAPRMMSGAFHDALYLASICPTAMLFVPCEAGISHHPSEHVEKADAIAACRVLAAAVEQLLD